MSQSISVNEIFQSIDGEGIRQGELVVFIRLTGCNMRCRYCDTTYALDKTSGIELSIDEIMSKVDGYKTKKVTLTGGEPLIHKNIDELIARLLKDGYELNIETNGSIDISPYVNKDLIITMDYKTPSSGTERLMLLENLSKLRERDVLKFVCNYNDLGKVKEIIKRNNPKSYIYLSPIFGEIEPFNLVDFLKDINAEGINTSKIRVQVQLHKIIWNPNQRGV